MINPNIKIIGLFGQSGAGKTTVIRNVKTPINGHLVNYNTGIIRYLFNKNGDYLSPNTLIKMFNEDNTLDTKVLMERYVKSQFQLLNDFSTEVFLTSSENTGINTYMLLDRSPIDFYALTMCGLEYLSYRFNTEINDTTKHFVQLLKTTAEKNTKRFFKSIIITKPWKNYPANEDKDGIRDEYLSSYFTNKNWYDRFDECDIGDCKVFTLPENISDIIARGNMIGSFLGEI